MALHPDHQFVVPASRSASIAIVPAFERRTPIISSAIIRAALVCGRSAAQAGFLAVLVVRDLVFVFDGGQTGFHVIKFRGADHVFRFGGKDGSNLFL